MRKCAKQSESDGIQSTRGKGFRGILLKSGAWYPNLKDGVGMFT